MKFRSRLKTSAALIDLTPLVDVIFLLLIFFIVTSNILPLKSLLIENPTLNNDSQPIMSQLLLVVDAQHVIYVGSKKSIVDLDALQEHLQRELTLLKKESASQEPTIVLSIDRRVDYGLFLQLFAIAQSCCPRLRLVYQPAAQKEVY